MPINWNWNPLIGAALLLPLWAYAHGVMRLWRGGNIGRGVTRWQVAAFLLGMVVLFVALISPLDPLSEQLLSAHMVQHVLLMVVAPPLLVVGAPPTVFLWVLPLRWRRGLGLWFIPGTTLRRIWNAASGGFAAWALHAAAIWLWHAPGLYQAALVYPGIHLLEHVTFFGTALLFWQAALPRDERRYLLGALLIFTTALHSSILGALMTFGSTVWYPFYVERAPQWGLSALEDQQLAGLIMWVPAGVIYLLAALVLFGTWLQRMERAEQSPNRVIE